MLHAFRFLLLLAFCIAVSIPQLQADIVFEDDFMGDNVNGVDPVNWQWWINPGLVWVDEADDVPEHGPGVLILGDQGETVHIGLEVDEVKQLKDYRVDVLFTDRLIVGEENDADFHIGIRCQEYDTDSEPSSCYEVEFDGDDNGPNNEVPETGPTSFYIFTRGGDSELRGDEEFVTSSTRDIVPRPIKNQWYWLSLQAVGNVLSAKVWKYGEEEPDWILATEDTQNEFESGGVRVGVWSGQVHIAYIKVETVTEAPPTPVRNWPLFE